MKTTKKTAKAKAIKKPIAKAKKTAKAKTKKTKKSEKTHILAIIDKSSSMNRVKEAAIEGFNTFLSAQKKLKDTATMNVWLFSNYNRITPLYGGKILSVNDVQDLNDESYVPEGYTALHDAMVKSMTDLKLSINAMKPSKRPDKILVVIITDGQENDSRDYPKNKIDEVKKLVEIRKDENWQFIFMCSTEETALTADALGFSKGNVFQYTNDAAGNEKMFFAAGAAATTYRSTSLKSKSFARISNNLLAEDEVQPDVKQPDTDSNLV